MHRSSAKSEGERERKREEERGRGRERERRREGGREKEGGLLQCFLSEQSSSGK